MKIHIQKFYTIFLWVIMLLSGTIFALEVTQESLDSLLLGEEKDAYVFPERRLNGELTSEDVIFESEIIWPSSKKLTIRTRGNIIFEEGGKLICQNGSSLSLEPGMEAGDLDFYTSTVIFKENITQVELEGGGAVKIFYNATERIVFQKQFLKIQGMLKDLGLKNEKSLHDSIYDLVSGCPLHGIISRMMKN